MAKPRPARRQARPSVATPMSIRFPSGLRRRIRRFARGRGLEEATAIRMMVAERLNEIELNEDLSKAEEWQRAQVYETLERLERGEVELVSMDRIYETLARGLERARKSQTSA